MTREEALSKAIMTLIYFQEHFCKSKEAVDNTQAIIDTLEQIEQEPKWIPVSERLPEDGEEVLCFLGSEEMAVLFRRNDWGQDEWVDGGFATGSYDVVAWMPLPKPYKAESEVDS